MMVGNKCDISSERQQVTLKMVRTIPSDIRFFEASAKCDRNISGAFRYAIQDIQVQKRTKN